MKIFFATEDYYPVITGGAIFERSLAFALVKRGHEVRIAAPSEDFNDREEKDHETLIYRQKSLPIPFYSHYRLSVTPYKNIFKVMSEWKPEVAHVHNSFSLGKATVKAARKLKIPVLSTNHTMPNNFFSFMVGKKFLEDNLYSFGWDYIVDFNNQADFVTSPSKTGVNLLKEHGLKIPARPISNGINLEKFHPWEEKAKLKKKFNLPNLPIVLYTGRLDPEKEVNILIQAIPLVLKEVKAHFVVGGRGKDKEKIEKMVESLGVEKSVTFAGFLSDEDYPKLYGVGDLYCMPSRAELLSISTLEALASGLPAIVRNAGALPELIDGNGYTFTTYMDLSSKIIEVLKDKDLQLSLSLKSLEVAKRHDFVKTVDQFEELYKELKTQMSDVKT